MVTDDEIKKVVLLCDPIYVEKANRRAGGVGTEAQIVSPELYAQAEQDKFVAVVMERSDEGAACLPAYYRSRIHIDLSNQENYSVNFDQLLRWIFDKPLHVRPPIGTPPAFLAEAGSRVALATGTRHRRAIEAVRANAGIADGAVSDYFECLACELENLSITEAPGEYDDMVVEMIDAFLPYRNEVVELVDALARYRDSETTHQLIHRFFEQLLPYLEPSRKAGRYHAWSSDHFRFVIHELFLYIVATLLRHERFVGVSYLLNNEYYAADRRDGEREVMLPFSVFRTSLESLDHRNRRLELKRISLKADFFKQRCTGLPVRMHDLLQADFVLYIRDQLHLPEKHVYWWPHTLLYAHDQPGPFEVFARARSSAYFERMKVVLAIASPGDMREMVERFAEPQFNQLRYDHMTLSPLRLLGHNGVCTRP